MDERLFLSLIFFFLWRVFSLWALVPCVKGSLSFHFLISKVRPLFQMVYIFFLPRIGFSLAVRPAISIFLSSRSDVPSFLTTSFFFPHLIDFAQLDVILGKGFLSDPFGNKAPLFKFLSGRLFRQRCISRPHFLFIRHDFSYNPAGGLFPPFFLLFASGL